MGLRGEFGAERVNAKPADFPFSFTYGGRTTAEFLPAWKLERTTARSQPGRFQRTITCTDPATGLRVRCDLTEYGDFPAVEWVLHFENRGTQDSPILGNILPLDAEIKTAVREAVVVHHSLGEQNSGKSFAPVEDVLEPGSNERVFAPVGGRSSDGHLPFFNLGATFISSNVKELIGYEADDFINDSVFWVNHIDPEDRQRVLENLSCLFDADKHIHQYRFLHKNGDYRWMQDALRLIRNKDGQPVDIAGYWIDITELKKTQKALEEARLQSTSTKLTLCSQRRLESAETSE